MTATAFLSEYGWYAAFTCVGVYLLLQHLRKNRSTDSQSSPVSTSSQGQNPQWLLSADWDVRGVCVIAEVCVSRLQTRTLWWGVRRLWRRPAGDCRRSRTLEQQSSERDSRGWVSRCTPRPSVCLTVLMLLPLICLAGGGQEKTENRDVGEHEGGKELQGKGTSCTSKSPVTNVSRPQVSGAAFTYYFSFPAEHRRGHFLQLTETKDRQKAPSQQWYASVTSSLVIIQMVNSIKICFHFFGGHFYNYTKLVTWNTVQI